MEDIQAKDNLKPICVVLDTNIWLRNSLLRNPLGAALFFSLTRLGGCIGLPEIVEEEIIRNVIKEGRELVNAINKSYQAIAVLLGSRDDFKVPSEADFEASSKNRLGELQDILRRIPFTLEHAKSALVRVNERTPPNSPNNQQFKDSGIWEAVLELSRSYTIHFLTADKAFFAGHDSSKGLAANLRADCRAIGATINAYEDLSSYLKTLKDDVPQLDYKELAATIDREIKDELEEFGTRKDFAVLGMDDFSISAFLTEKKNILALSFEHIYQAVDTQDFSDALPIDSLIAKGDCQYDYSSQKLSEIRLSVIEYRAASGQLVGAKSRSTVFAESITLGRRQVPYTFREPL